MRELTQEQKQKILNLVNQLGEAIDEANCRLLARNASWDWSATLIVVPTEIEMGQYAAQKPDENGEMQSAEPIDEKGILDLPIDCTVYSTATNALYEEGDCGNNYF